MTFHKNHLILDNNAILKPMSQHFYSFPVRIAVYKIIFTASHT
jgi:hypothetical protein